MKKQFLPLLLSILLVLPAVSSSAYEARHWLRDMATPDELGSLIVSPEEWTGAPAYADREGWTAFLGDTRNEYVRRGEKVLDYQWQVITAQMYLEFYRSGTTGTLYGDPPRGVNSPERTVGTKTRSCCGKCCSIWRLS